MSTALRKPPAIGRLSGPYRLTVIRDLNEFEALGKRWDAFLQRCGIENLCMTHRWLRTWLHHFPPAELAVIILSNPQGEWVAAAPFQIAPARTGLVHKKLRHLQFVGTQPTVYDWMRIAVHPQADEQAALHAIAEAIRGFAWDVLDLTYCPDQAQLAKLCDMLGGRADSVYADMPIPYTPLPATEAEYAKTRRKKTRLEVNRHRNRFEKEMGEAPRLVFMSPGTDMDTTLDTFVAGHIRYWAERGCRSDFQRFPGLAGFYRDMIEADRPGEPDPRLLFSVLMVDDTQLSYHLGFWQGQSYLSHLTNFNQDYKTYSPGTIHMDALVFDTIARGGVEFEFGRGDEPYKKMWAQGKKPLWSMRLFRNPAITTLWCLDPGLKRIKRALSRKKP